MVLEGCKVLGKKILWYYNVIAEIPQHVAHVVDIAFDLNKITKSCKVKWICVNKQLL